MASHSAPPPSEVATASDAFRQILSCQDENILVALRDSVSLADLARLHDLVGSRVFTELVNFVGPSAAAPAATPTQPSAGVSDASWGVLPAADNNRTWADASDPPSDVTPYREEYLSGKILGCHRALCTKSLGRLRKAGSLQSACRSVLAVCRGQHGGLILTCSVCAGKKFRAGLRCRSP